MFQSNPRGTMLMVTLVGVAAAVAISVAIGQQAVQPLPGPSGYGGAVNHHHYYGGAASAPGSGGYGANLSGLTNPAAARGQYNVDTAQALQTLSQTQHQSMENHNFAVSSYYQNKDVHEQYMKSHEQPRLTTEQLDKIAEKAGPGRLSSTQFDRSTNVIQWPALLRDSQFSDLRYKVDKLFHDRTPDESGADSDNYVNIKQACDAMHQMLHGMIKDLPPVTYIAADHFIRSLAYEGRFAAQ